MIKKKILIILLVVGTNCSIYAQIDTAFIKTNTILHLLFELPRWNGTKLDKHIVNKVLIAPIKVDFLQSNGFDNFVFTFVPIGDAGSTIDSIIFMGGCKGYIIAIDLYNLESYRISGFYENDILKLLSILKRRSYHHLVCANSFSKHYAIEGVDLKCLYRAAKKNSRDTKKYPCLKYCGEPIWIY